MRAVAIWNKCGGAIDWVGLGILTEYYSIKDVELLLDSIFKIQEFQATQDKPG